MSEINYEEIYARAEYEFAKQKELDELQQQLAAEREKSAILFKVLKRYCNCVYVMDRPMRLVEECDACEALKQYGGEGE